MAKTKTVRQPKAKDAYELLERVCVAIKEHPLSYWQGYWKATRGYRGGGCGDVCELPESLNTSNNTCGTAFCRAGWMVALHDGMRAKPASFEGRAKELIGVYKDDGVDCVLLGSTDRLFEGGAVDGTPGTRPYVNAGIKGIRAFMKKHAAHLKARKLRGV